MAAASTNKNKARSEKRRLERFGEDETGLVVVGADMFASQIESAATAENCVPTLSDRLS
jgi:hypothetical protein